eukprot:TRINITY_DN2538_c0_g1_i7.p1 TRINITY_DN2538_c0_g1~~TRINITY_DN2538_c0_g1_i7.p1  ORF type:complete len:125 (-),score=10.40 TRINITY_DN2538_c0_g1_i7:117-491(-)
MALYIVLYLIGWKVFQVIQFGPVLTVISILYLVYCLYARHYRSFLLATWIATQVYIFGKDWDCRESNLQCDVGRRALWHVLFIWTVAMYCCLFGLVLVSALGCKIGIEYLFPSTFTKTEQNKKG